MFTRLRKAAIRASKEKYSEREREKEKKMNIRMAAILLPASLSSLEEQHTYFIWFLLCDMTPSSARPTSPYPPIPREVKDPPHVSRYGPGNRCALFPRITASQYCQLPRGQTVTEMERGVMGARRGKEIAAESRPRHTLSAKINVDRRQKFV